MKKIVSSLIFKISMVFVVFFVLNVFVFIKSKQIFEEQKDYGSVINVAGRQRMLSQKISKEILEHIKSPSVRTKKSIINSSKLFETTLDVLQNGGDVALDLQMTKFRTCPKPRNESISKQLASVQKLWKRFKKKIDIVLSDSDHNGKALAYIKRNNMSLLKQMNKAVGLMQADSEEIAQKFINFQKYILLIIIAFLFASLYVFNKVLIKRLVLLKSIMEFITKGDLTHLLNSKSTDEIGEISSSIDETTKTLASLIGELKTSAGVLDTASEDILENSNDLYKKASQAEANTGNVLNVAREVNVNATEVTNVAADIANNISTSAAAISELSSTVNEIARNCQAEVNIVNKANSKVKSTLELMERLGDSANVISKVVETINDVADKTNLLAFNATIEAASAGDAGKGFAVVANEVKELAKQTATATLEIEGLVNDIQKNAGDSISSIKDIVDVIDEVNSISHVIVSAVEEQSATINNISQTTSNNSLNASKVATNMEQISGSISGLENELDGIRTSVTRSAQASQEIELLSKNLQELSRSFELVIAKFVI